MNWTLSAGNDEDRERVRAISVRVLIRSRMSAEIAGRALDGIDDDLRATRPSRN